MCVDLESTAHEYSTAEMLCCLQFDVKNDKIKRTARVALYTFSLMKVFKKVAAKNTACRLIPPHCGGSDQKSESISVEICDNRNVQDKDKCIDQPIKGTWYRKHIACAVLWRIQDFMTTQNQAYEAITMMS